MARIAAVLICSVLISSAASGLPRADIALGPSPVVFVQETSSIPGWDSSEGYQSSTATDCRRYTPSDAPSECTAYWRRILEINREKRAKEKAAREHAEPAKPAGKKAAARALGEHERNAVAPKPLIPARAAAPIKAAPGNTLEERVRRMSGQLLVTGFSGRQQDDVDVERVAGDLREGRLSGIIVRDSNIESAAQLSRLITTISDADGEIAPLIVIEQPGGPDTVLSEDKGFAFYSSANAITSSGTPYEAQLVYRGMASELAALGVTLNIGPSEDVCRENGVNLSALCFGTSPPVIAAYARAFNFGHHDRGVLTALRHVPFRAGLRTALIGERPGSAMLHLHVKGETSDALVVNVKAMEPLRLANLFLEVPRSSRLRSFGFRGALIFDMDMGTGIAPMLYGEAMVRALQAGADMIIVREPSTLPSGFPAISADAIQAAIKSGRLQMARLEDAYRHVQTLKARLRTFPARTKVAGLDRDPLSQH